MLFLLWLALGLGIGFLTCLARLIPPAWMARRWLTMPLLGALIAPIAGWLGIWLLGRYDATAVVLWVTILGTVCIPRLCARVVMLTSSKL